MFRIVDRSLGIRQIVSDWIHKMLFMWTREPTEAPRASPWFAWLATALLIWGYRRRIFRIILAISPLRLLKRRKLSLDIELKTQIMSRQEVANNEKKLTMILHPKSFVDLKSNMKRMYPGDGLHVSNCTDIVQTAQQVHYRVTRSGRVYGTYPNKVVITS